MGTEKRRQAVTTWVSVRREKANVSHERWPRWLKRDSLAALPFIHRQASPGSSALAAFDKTVLHFISSGIRDKCHLKGKHSFEMEQY